MGEFDRIEQEAEQKGEQELEERLGGQGQQGQGGAPGQGGGDPSQGGGDPSQGGGDPSQGGPGQGQQADPNQDDQQDSGQS